MMMMVMMTSLTVQDQPSTHLLDTSQHLSTSLSIPQHPSTSLNISQHTSLNISQHTSIFLNIPQHRISHLNIPQIISRNLSTTSLNISQIEAWYIKLVQRKHHTTTTKYAKTFCRHCQQQTFDTRRIITVAFAVPGGTVEKHIHIQFQFIDCCSCEFLS